MGKAASGIKQPNELSGFGFPEAATAVEVCTRDDCYKNNEPLVTDLYCRSHGRFLPLISAPISLRVLLAIISTLIIYGSFELTAQRNSRLPVFIIYAVIGFGLVILPLRHFTRTAVIASLIWVIASVIPITSSSSSGHFRVVLAAATLVGSISILAIYAIAGTPYTVPPGSPARELRVIARIVAVALIIAIWTAVASLALHYESYVLPGSERRIARFLLIIALISLAVSALVISATSVVIGVRNMKLQVRTLRKPRRPTWVAPGANVLLAIGRIIANCVAQVAYVLAYTIIALTNVVIRFVVLTARWVQATIASVVRLSFYAIFIACRRIFDPIASVFVPVGALVGTPWLVMALAGETRLYLLHGPLIALRNMTIMVLAAVALLLGTWVILANQHPRDSFRSFERSAPVTIAYGFVILFFGGWLLALPRAFGYGHIHVGRVTLWSTGIVVIVLLVLGVSRLVGSKGNKQSAPSPVAAPISSSASGTGGRTWTIGVAFVMIVSAATSLAILAPWTSLPLARPTGLTADTWTMNSVTISWSRPASGPLPTRYVIMQNGQAIGSVPGIDTSYRATGLAPSTRYTYQVFAVRGAHRSPWSSAMMGSTRVPALWTATLTGQWTVHYTHIILSNVTNLTLTSDTWIFSPECTASQCPVSLTGQLNGNQFTASLHQSRGVYTTETTNDTFLQCGSNPTAGDLTLHIDVLTGAIVSRHWVVSSWTGSMVFSTPASGDCSASQVTATINATQ
jgi:Fibronectin type III domain